MRIEVTAEQYITVLRMEVAQQEMVETVAVVGDNSILPAGNKQFKLTYAEIERTLKAVEKQNKLIEERNMSVNKYRFSASHSINE